MIVIFSVIFALLGVLSSFVAFQSSSLQPRVDDTVSKNDVNALFQKLEEHYNEWGYYPLAPNVNTQSLPDIDPEAFIDGNGNTLNNGDYYYIPVDCDIVGCQSYTLGARLNSGENFEKRSLNN